MCFGNEGEGKEKGKEEKREGNTKCKWAQSRVLAVWATEKEEKEGVITVMEDGREGKGVEGREGAWLK